MKQSRSTGACGDDKMGIATKASDPERMKRELRRATIGGIKENQELFTFTTGYGSVEKLNDRITELLVKKSAGEKPSGEDISQLLVIIDGIATKEDYKTIARYDSIMKKIRTVEDNITRYTRTHSDVNGIKSEINKRAMFERELDTVSGPVDALVEKIANKYISYCKRNALLEKQEEQK